MINTVQKAYAFGDLCIVPRLSKINSRMSVNFFTPLTKKTNITLPIIPSNMDTVISSQMTRVLIKNGGYPIYHRFSDMEDQLSFVQEFENKCYISAGIVKETEENRLKQLIPYARGVCFDVAHGHCQKMIDIIEWFKKEYKDKEVIAGNICTPEAYIDLANSGADALKVGIGSGAACTTRKMTGLGVPQLSAIIECAELYPKYNVPIIADGGIQGSGEMAKALAAGAHSVMCGKMFAQTFESNSEKVYKLSENKYVHTEAIANVKELDDKTIYCKYRGQASNDFQLDFYGSMRPQIAPEGESFYVPVFKKTQQQIDEMLGGVRSSMTMQGVDNIKDLHKYAKFREVLPGYVDESNVRK